MRLAARLANAGLVASLAATALAAPRAAHQATGRRYEAPNGHTMVIVRGAEFTMGSPPGERGRSDDETPHRVRIPRTFAVATTEVTNEQFARFLDAVPDYAKRWRAATTARFGDPPRFAEFSKTPDSPQVAVSWYDAARYCNWLSVRDGLGADQFVYPEWFTTRSAHRGDVTYFPKSDAGQRRTSCRPYHALSLLPRCIKRMVAGLLAIW